MNVLINTVDINGNGGVANYYRNLRPYLDQSIHYFVVGQRSIQNGLLSNFFRIFTDYFLFILRLCTQHYDIVHLNPSLIHKALLRDAVFLLIAKLFRKRVVVFMRGWNHECQRKIDCYFLGLFRLVFFRADSFIVLADEFKFALEKWGYDGTIFTETTVVSDEVFTNTNPIALGRGDQLQWNILFLTRVEQEKGIYLALETLKILLDRFPQVKMTVAGDGKELQKARCYASRLGIKRINFTGYLRGAAKQMVFNESHCYLFPSLHGEGMPNSVLEAMAYGLPIVTRPVGGLRDFFEQGKMGFMVESKEPAAFAETIEILLEDKQMCARMGQYNRDYACKRFAASHVALRLGGIYSQIMTLERKNGV